MSEYSDNAIMLAVKDGTVEKLSILYERHKNQLYGFFYRHTNQKESSEDLVQSVFYRILKYKHAFEGTGTFRTWMYHIAHNVYADYYKKLKTNKENFTFIDNKESIGTEHNEYEQKESIRTIRNALRSLPAEKREVLILSRFQDLKYKEIAEILETTESNVKVRVFRALNELKEILNQ